MVGDAKGDVESDIRSLCFRRVVPPQEAALSITSTSTTASFSEDDTCSKDDAPQIDDQVLVLTKAEREYLSQKNTNSTEIQSEDEAASPIKPAISTSETEQRPFPQSTEHILPTADSTSEKVLKESDASDESDASEEQCVSNEEDVDETPEDIVEPVLSETLDTSDEPESILDSNLSLPTAIKPANLPSSPALGTQVIRPESGSYTSNMRAANTLLQMSWNTRRGSYFHGADNEQDDAWLMYLGSREYFRDGSEQLRAEVTRTR